MSNQMQHFGQAKLKRKSAEELDIDTKFAN